MKDGNICRFTALNVSLESWVWYYDLVASNEDQLRSSQPGTGLYQPTVLNSLVDSMMGLLTTSAWIKQCYAVEDWSFQYAPIKNQYPPGYALLGSLVPTPMAFNRLTGGLNCMWQGKTGVNNGFRLTWSTVAAWCLSMKWSPFLQLAIFFMTQ